MSGGESRQTPLPKGQLRDCAESERQRKTHSPRTVTYILNRPLHAQTMHVFSRQDCILFCTPLSGRHMSHYTGAISFKNFATIMPSHHSNGTGGAHWMARLDLKAVCYVLTYTSKLKNSAVASKLSHHIEGADGTCWMTKPVEESQILEALCSHVRQDRSSSLRQDTASLRVRSSHGTNAHHTLLCQQEPKRGPAVVLVTVYRHVVMYVGLTQKGHNGTAVLTDIAPQAIKPRGLSPMSPSIVTVINHLGTVSFIRTVSKIGWDPQRVLLTIGKLKLMQVAPGEPFLPFPREGVG